MTRARSDKGGAREGTGGGGGPPKSRAFIVHLIRWVLVQKVLAVLLYWLRELPMLPAPR